MNIYTKPGCVLWHWLPILCTFFLLGKSATWANAPGFA